jgi:hypothetical protein
MSVAFACFLICNSMIALLQKRNPEASAMTEEVTCGHFLNESEIIRDSEYWQEMKTSNGTVKLFNAYLDTRMDKTFVRVNVNSVDLNITNDTIFCQFWFEGQSKARVVKAQNFTLLWILGFSLSIICFYVNFSF